MAQHAMLPHEDIQSLILQNKNLNSNVKGKLSSQPIEYAMKGEPAQLSVVLFLWRFFCEI
jgi:hypothetical protein